MIKAVLFDLDSTLIDFIKMKRIASEQVASAMVDPGLDMDKQDVSQALFKMYLKVGIESDVVFSKFLEKFVLRKAVERITRCLHVFIIVATGLVWFVRFSRLLEGRKFAALLFMLM